MAEVDPSIALSYRPPASPLDMYAKVQAIRGSQQEQQVRQQEMDIAAQKQQQDQYDRQTFGDAYIEGKGDPEAVSAIALQRHVSPDFVDKWRTSTDTHQKMLQDKSTAERAKIAEQNQAIAQASQALLGLPQEQRWQALNTTIGPGLVKLGIPQDQVNNTQLDDRTLQLHAVGSLKVGEQLAEIDRKEKDPNAPLMKPAPPPAMPPQPTVQAPGQAPIALMNAPAQGPAQAQAPPQQAAQAPPTGVPPGQMAGPQQAAQQPAQATGIPPEITAMNAAHTAIYQSRHPGETLPDALTVGPNSSRAQLKQVDDFFKEFQQAEHTTATEKAADKRIGLTINNQSGGPALSDTATDQAAQRYLTTGQLPQLGRGRAADVRRTAIMNRASELDPNGDITSNKANYDANAKSLAGLQKQADTVDAFEKTAGKNLDIFLTQAQKVIDTGSPFLNTPVRMVTGKMGGTDQVAFDTARTVALTEISKVLNSANASSVVSDSARHEVEGLIGKDANLQQIMRAAQILKQDMANRHQSYQDQINDINSRLKHPTKGGTQQQAGGTIKARDPQGKLHEAPAGTPLPAGWKAE